MVCRHSLCGLGTGLVVATLTRRVPRRRRRPSRCRTLPSTRFYVSFTSQLTHSLLSACHCLAIPISFTTLTITHINNNTNNNINKNNNNNINNNNTNTTTTTTGARKCTGIQTHFGRRWWCRQNDLCQATFDR